MKLYYSDFSPPCRAVNMVVHALNIPVEIVEVNLFGGEHLNPEFVKLNPTHTIPMVDDDGFILYDSHAICTFLVSKYGKDDSLYPKDLQKRAKVDEQLHYHNGVFITFKGITRPVLQQNNSNISDESIAKIVEVYNISEKILEKQDYFAGNQLTLADICQISLLPCCKVYAPMPEEKYPRLNAWMSRCSKNIKDYKEVNCPGAEALVNAIAKVIHGA